MRLFLIKNDTSKKDVSFLDISKLDGEIGTSKKDRVGPYGQKMFAPSILFYISHLFKGTFFKSRTALNSKYRQFF